MRRGFFGSPRGAGYFPVRWLPCCVVSLAGVLHAADGVPTHRILENPAVRQADRPVISAVTIDPSGRWIAAAGDDHSILLWDVQGTGGPLVRTSHRDWVRALAFTPDGQLISAGNDGQVLRWDLRSEALPEVLFQRPSAISALAISGDGKWLVTTAFEDRIQVFDLESNLWRRDLECPCRDLRALAFSPEGHFLAAGGRSGAIRLWSWPEGNEAGTIRAHSQRIRGLVFSHDGGRLVSTSEDGTVRVWRIPTGEAAGMMESGSVQNQCLALVGPERLATGGSNNEIRLWDLTELKEIGTLRGHTGSVAALSVRGGLLVSGSFDTSVRLWTLPVGPGLP